ncbi:hypothetical protein L1987_23055 [Smallanthus sonchifolius]|uniref:Uncharacterized protein n=1 Tax=Smallanthus sonchifolius TaxID=185202 RepID=A0ACB9II14_9ASTR|nr:hypothetical protein L1987_23055 [Smallanthus sonchifolius]
MSCNGCRVLRKGCSDNCVLRPCLEWIQSPDAQAHATLFLSKFFGRSDLFNFISAAPSGHQRTELFQSLLYEAVGRTVNPVNGAMGLLSTGNWHLCEEAMQTVLAGGTPATHWIPEVEESADNFQSRAAWGVMMIRNQNDASNSNAAPLINVMTADVMPGSDVAAVPCRRSDGEEPNLLNLFK